MSRATPDRSDRSAPRAPFSGFDSGSGTGSDAGSGSGTGVATGTGVGTGSGTGSGTGVSTGSGVGIGSGAGTGSGSGIGTDSRSGFDGGAGISSSSGFDARSDSGTGTGTGTGTDSDTGTDVGIGTGIGTKAPSGGGLRERKKRLMRRQLSDTATELFLTRGFDAVSVAEIAEACGVSEKTVFNYFPTKESLLLDRWDGTVGALRTALAEPDLSPVDAALRVLSGELAAMASQLEASEDPAVAADRLVRFGDMLRSASVLRARWHEMAGELATAAAEVLAARWGIGPDDPEPQIAATALAGLWQIQYRSMRAHLTGGVHAPAQLYKAVTSDVVRAARVVDAGLGSLEERVDNRGASRDGRRAVVSRPPRP